MKTYMANPATVERKWYVVDATKMPLGRLASQVADILTGKNKPIYTPHVDTGDFVIVINADQVVLTGKKLEQKKLRWHTGYIGGLKEVDYKTLMEKNSCKVIEKAVKGMLPKTSMGRKQITRLHVCKDAEHNHQAQKPEVITLKGVIE
ncbi:MAG: 50S ribosomal protein L13 [Clostridiales bacterium]|nr:50S ribosomal protein L13 [Clostridiales bacterium]